MCIRDSLIFGRLLLVSPCTESVLFQCLHQYQLGVRVHLHLPEYAAVSYTHLDVYKRQPINNTHPGLRGLTQMILGVLIIRNF